MSYEFDGKEYRKASVCQKEWGNKVISDMDLKGSERILDLGCGDGVLTEKLSQLVPNGHVSGIDASKGMIDAAKELKRDNLSFKVMDINEIDFDNEFDVIFSNATLHWVKNHHRLITYCKKALKYGGYLRFNFAGDGNCPNFFASVREVMKTPIYEKYFDGFEWPYHKPKVEDYEKFINQFGFSEMKIWGENADRYFQTSEEMAKWIENPSIVPFLKVIDEKDKKTFCNEVINKTIKRTIQPNGTCFEEFRRINVYAKK